MQRLYNFLTFILAVTGSFSIVISGEINYLLSCTGIGIFLGYYRLFKGMPQAPKWTISGLSVLTLLVFLIDSMISNDYFIAIAHLSITFQAIKSFDLKDPWDHLQVYFMSLLQLIIASELIYSILFGAIFFLFMIASVAAIIFSHFISEGAEIKASIRKPIASVTILIVFFTVLLFIAVPRTSEGLWGKGHSKGIRTVGFSERVDFGSFGNVKLDPTIVMRIEINQRVKEPYYWRGMTLDYFDGISWRDTMREKERIYKVGDIFVVKRFYRENAIIQKIFKEPMDTEVIFGLSDISGVEATERIILRNDAGSLFFPSRRRKQLYYSAYSINRFPKFTEYTTHYLQLPYGMERIYQLAEKISGQEDSNIDKALSIERYLRDNYTYSLSTSPPPEGMNPIEDFLFHSRKGFCEHYSTSMVLMLRSIGIPSRIVTGFVGGELNEYGGYIIVRQSNAHSWVEAVIDGRWRLFDPTPAVFVEKPSAFLLYLDMLRMKWNRYVIAFSSSDQVEILKTISLPFRMPFIPDFRPHWSYRILYIFILILSAFLFVFLFKKKKFKRYPFVTTQYVKLRNKLKAQGAEISIHSTPSDVKGEAVRLGFDKRVLDFIDMYERYRFGGLEMTVVEKKRYRDIFSKVYTN